MKKPNVMTVTLIGVGLVGIAFYVHRKIITLQTDINRLSEATMKTVKHIGEMNAYGTQIQELSTVYKKSTKQQKTQEENTAVVYDEVVELRKTIDALLEQLEVGGVKVVVPARRKMRKIQVRAPEKKPVKGRRSRKWESEDEDESEDDSDDDSDDEDVGRILSRVKRS